MEYISVKEAAGRWQMTERRVTALCRDLRIAGAQKRGQTWLIPAVAERPLDGRTRAYAEREGRPPSPVSYTESGAAARVRDAFSATYRKEPENVAFTPYRVCPLGAHSDHQLGKITGFAIDKGIYIAYGAKQNGVIEISSLQFPKRAQWHVADTPEKKQNDWADHLRGATLSLAERYPLRIGLCAVIDGELPIGGLSSSAAVILTFLSALCTLNRIRLSTAEMIEISQEAENRYVGVGSGRLDQSCEVYCRKDHLLYMDMKTDFHECIPTPPGMKPFDIVIFFSGVERALAGSGFNMRVDECRSAAYALKAYAGLPYGRFADTYLRDVPREVYDRYRDRLPEAFGRRAEHWYSEFARVEAGVETYRRGDLDTFGRLVFESGRSSIENWETGSPELIRLYELMTKERGIYGGRFSGAGFKGCCMALVDPAETERASAHIKEGYLASFPTLCEKFSVHVCHTADGVCPRDGGGAGKEKISW